ncbi:unnamed protein product, partial [Heterosigma akashiwo]
GPRSPSSTRTYVRAWCRWQAWASCWACPPRPWTVCSSSPAPPSPSSRSGWLREGGFA